MEKTVFTVYGDPIGKARPRWFRGHMYTPKKTRMYEEKIRESFREEGGKKFPDECYIGVKVICYYKIPKSASGKKKEEMNTGILRPVKKPDIDNVLKCVLDGLNGTAYEDDKQVVRCSISKHYGFSPKIMVTVYEEKE